MTSNEFSVLRGVEAKLARAEQQIEAVRNYPQAWAAREKPYLLRPQVDEGKRRYIWMFEVRKEMPPDPAVICDEIIHHLRSVLDHLACYLVEANGCKPTNSTKWPIEGSKCGWKRNVERRQSRWQFWRKEGQGPLKGIPRGGTAWTFVESSQPYHRGGKARDDLLFSLNDNWNRNKHRVLNPFWLEAHPAGDPLALFDVTPEIEPIESRWIMRRGYKIEHETEVAIFKFPDGKPFPRMEVKVDAPFPVQIAMGDDKGPGVDLDETLKLVRRIAAEVAALPKRS